MTKIREISNGGTYHDGDEMAVIVGQRSVTLENEVLGAQEDVQIGWVVTHHLTNLVQSVALEKCIDEQHV